MLLGKDLRCLPFDQGTLEPPDMEQNFEDFVLQPVFFGRVAKKFDSVVDFPLVVICDGASSIGIVEHLPQSVTRRRRIANGTQGLLI